MANNNGIFNAAVAGATSSLASRWQTSTESSHYDVNGKARIVAFATQVDSDIPADPTLSQAAFDLMEAICSAWWDDRDMPTDKDIPSEYEPEASTIVAMWESMFGALLPPGAGPVPLDPGEVPKMLYDQAPGVIGYTEILWDEAAQNSSHPIGVGAAFGSLPAESGGIRLSSESNGGTVTYRNNANDRDNLMIRAGGVDDIITLGEIDPDDATNRAIDLIGEMFDEGALPFYIRVASTEELDHDAVAPGTLLLGIETVLADPRGGITIAGGSLVDTDHDGYGVSLIGGSLTTTSDGLVGAAVSVYGGNVEATLNSVGETSIGGPVVIQGGSVQGSGAGGANDILFTGGQVRILGGPVEIMATDDATQAWTGGGILIQGATPIQTVAGTPVLGGEISILSGGAGGDSGDGGFIEITGGEGGNVGGSGGSITILGGGANDGNGGTVQLIGGNTPGGEVGSVGGLAIVRAGNSGGVGGDTLIQHGVGVGGGVAGSLSLGNTTVATVIEINSSANGTVTGMGFFGTIPTTQLASYPAFTDAGTPSGTNVLGDVGAVFNQANINNNFATCAVAFNDILDILETYGLTA